MVPPGVHEFAVKISELVPLRSMRECRVHRDVSGHPNVGKFFRSFTSAPYMLILTELLPGGDLRSVCERYTCGLPETTVVEIGLQVARALAHMHNRGVAHCDIKPDNVLLCDAFSLNGGNVVKVVDFGLVTEFRVDENGEVNVPVFGGTPGYRPVESMNGRLVDPRKVDSHCLGVMMCEMLTGQHPFVEPVDGGDDLAAQARFKASSAGMQAVILWLMDAEPRNRPSAAVTVELLRQLVPPR